MAKPGDVKKCPKCPSDMEYKFDRVPDPEAVARGDKNPVLVGVRKYWRCDNCGYEDDSSMPAAE